MKILSKSLLFIVLFLITGCDSTFLDHLDDPNEAAPQDAEISMLFNNVQLNFNDFFLSVSSRTQDVVRMEAMASGDTYNNAYPANTFNDTWRIAYSELIPDLDAMIEIAEVPGNEISIYAGIAKVFKAYTYMTLVDLFGNVPFSEVNIGNLKLSPKSDDQAMIYAEMMKLLDSAILDLKKQSPSVAEFDMYYHGDTEKWIKFANTLKLKNLLSTRLVDSDFTAKIAELKDQVILEVEDDFQFQYGTTRLNPNSRHPYYNNHYEQGAGRYLSNYYMWSLDSEKGIQDPRLVYYFYRQLDPSAFINTFYPGCLAGGERPSHYVGDYPYCLASYERAYCGRDHGNYGIPPDGFSKTVVGVYPFGGKFDAINYKTVQNNGVDGGLGAGINPIMLSSFTNFMLAETALIAGDASAKDCLEKGIRQSIEKVIDFAPIDPEYSDTLAPSDDNINEYLAFVLNSYDAADEAGKLDIIIKEYHIAAWGNGIEMYNAYRRTGYPSEMQPTRSEFSGDFPRLFLYPSDHVELNENAQQQILTEQVFWDMNPAGFIN